MIMRIGARVRIRNICEHSWEIFSQSMKIRRFNGNQKVFRESCVCKLSLQYIFLRFSRDPSRTSSDDVSSLEETFLKICLPEIQLVFQPQKLAQYLL